MVRVVPAVSRSPLTLGVIGAGRWGKNWVRVCQSLTGARLTAVCDTRASCQAGLPISKEVRWFGAVHRMLDGMDLDAAVVATPTSSHAEVAQMCLDAGVHVLIEKPLTGNYHDALRISTHAGGRVMVGHLLRYHPAVLRLRSLIDSGELGDLSHIVSDRLGRDVSPQEERAWWALAPHDISVMKYLFGSEPETISTTSHSSRDMHPEDNVTACLTFGGERSGLIRVGNGTQKVRRITVVGERRVVTFTDGHLRAVLTHYDSSASLKGVKGADLLAVPLQPTRTETVAGVEPLQAQAQHFVDCLRSGAPFNSDVHEGLAVVRILEAGSRALRLGRMGHHESIHELGARSREIA